VYNGSLESRVDLTIQSDQSRMQCPGRFPIAIATLIACLPKAWANDNEAGVYPAANWSRVTPESVGMRIAPLRAARDYAASRDGSGMITRGGKLVISWGDTKRKFDLKSTSKSIGITSLGLAIDDGKMSLSDRAIDHHPNFAVPPEENRATGWINQITLRQLANQTAGFEKPGGYEKLLFAPGTHWNYSDGGPNWLAECVTLAMGIDIESLMFERILEPIGVSRDDLQWRPHQYRDRSIEGIRRCEFGSGVHANADAMARIGLLYLRRGVWNGRRLLSEEFIATVSRHDATLDGLPEWDDQHGDASQHYGMLWWNNSDGSIENVPTDAFWSWGLYDSLIVVIPSLDLVVARNGKSWNRTPGENHYDVLKPFLQPIVEAVGENAKAKSDLGGAPYPPSRNVGQLQWEGSEAIRRDAPGGDNWPITWMDDDSMLTAYGDGWGFAPKVERKLSMGFARITGGPKDFQGLNVRSATGERIGQGPNGVKASGLLMVDSVVYLLARNAGNSQLAWSRDRGITWQWSDWKFETSFGCPSFVNFGRNYAGARDQMVYVVSPDSESAYEPADRMVMARVHRDRVRDRDAYEFLVSVDADGTAEWSKSIEDRGAVFQHPGRCYRGAMTYHPVLKRYLWCQTLPESTHPGGPRFQGGFGIYDAAEPWGPWTTVFFTEQWDVGPGETSSLPSRWNSRDGQRLYLLFSGDDAFSVRRAVISD
jgi:CubicO group peptidase (beta-lactamase class C family)